MARGPKPDPTRPYSRHRGKDPSAAPLPSAPDGPVRPLPSGEWLPRARRWWREMASSSQARRWMDTDWQMLELGLVLVNRFYGIQQYGHTETGRKKWGSTSDAKQLATELRQIAGELGATPASRSRMGWGNPIQDPGEAVDEQRGEGDIDGRNPPTDVTPPGEDLGAEGGFLTLVEGGASS